MILNVYHLVISSCMISPWLAPQKTNSEGDFDKLTMLSDGETGEDVPLKLMNFEL